MQTHTNHPTHKVTAHIDQKLLEVAQKYTGKGITATITQGLERLAQDIAYEKMLKNRGKYKFLLDIDKLRED